MCNAILEAYVEELITAKQYGLIACYVSKLPASAQVHWYSLFLEGKTGREMEEEFYLLLCSLALVAILLSLFLEGKTGREIEEEFYLLHCLLALVAILLSLFLEGDTQRDE